MAQFEKLRQVGIVDEDIVAGRGLVQIPKDIRLDEIDSRHLALLENGGPHFGRATRIVYRATHEELSLAVEQDGTRVVGHVIGIPIGQKLGRR